MNIDRDLLLRTYLAESEEGLAAVESSLVGLERDPQLGLLEMRRAGAKTLAQDEASSVIFGMPREAIALGGAAQVVGLSEMPAALVEACERTTKETHRRG